MKARAKFWTYLTIAVVLIAVSFLYSALDEDSIVPTANNQLHQLSEKGIFEITE